MDLINMTKLASKHKKKTLLTVRIKCESKREAKNLKSCIKELLLEDLHKNRNNIKYETGEVK